jgi:hypothetical protein
MTQPMSDPIDNAGMVVLLRRLGIDADPADLPTLADNLALLSRHWAIVSPIVGDGDA